MTEEQEHDVYAKPKRVLDPDWANHPFTTRMVSGLKRDYAIAFEELLALCGRSSDPAVRAAHMRVRVLNDALVTFVEGEEKPDKGEGDPSEQ